MVRFEGPMAGDRASGGHLYRSNSPSRAIRQRRSQSPSRPYEPQNTRWHHSPAENEHSISIHASQLAKGVIEATDGARRRSGRKPAEDGGGITVADLTSLAPGSLHEPFANWLVIRHPD